MPRDQLVTYFAIGIGLIWAVVILASLVTGDITALTAITPVMLIVTTALFGFQRRNGNGKGDQK